MGLEATASSSKEEAKPTIQKLESLNYFPPKEDSNNNKTNPLKKHEIYNQPHPFPMLPDNSDNCSSVSFNTGVLYDQFDNMDSISQIMGNDYPDSNQEGVFDLKNVGGEISKRDKKIQDLLSDRTKLKNLLKKAKSAIDSINLKYKSSQET